jgi:hypothetical protein
MDYEKGISDYQRQLVFPKLSSITATPHKVGETGVLFS